MSLPRKCALPECNIDLDKAELRSDALYCGEAHSKRHRREESCEAARRGRTPDKARTGTRPPTEYAVLRAVGGDHWFLIGYAIANKAEQAQKQLVGDSVGHRTMPAKYWN